MLLELAIGDAYGAGFEYAPDSVIRRHNDLSRYIPHDRHGLKPGHYTDDTQMSLAIPKALASGPKCSRDAPVLQGPPSSPLRRTRQP